MVVSGVRALSLHRRSTYLFLVLIVGLIASSSGFTVLYVNLIVNRGLTPQQIYGVIEPSVVMVTVKVESAYGFVPYAQGSGFIYSKDGFIVTNYHVIAEADEVEVTLSDGTTTEAEPVGVDPYSDLAVIRVDLKLGDLKPVLIADSSSLRVGDSVLAVGNPYGLSGSMTQGIVSQLDRTLRTDYGYLIVGVVQTDAAINPGNSGGPLLNMRGEVVGVNSAIVSQTGEFSGVGFAIPSNLMVKVVSFLIRERRYTHPWLGLAGVDVTPAIAKVMGLSNARGFLVTYVTQESPAKKAGLKAGNRSVIVDGEKINVGGDVIVGVDGVTVRRLEDILVHIEYNRRPHDFVTLNIIRDGEAMSIAVELGERPPPS